MGGSAARPEQRSVSSYEYEYETILELGRGGMGTVYLARTVGAAGFARLVVLKRLHEHLLDEPDAVQRFLDEARMAAWVQHANVVSTHQVGSDKQGYFLVLEYIEGASLEELVDRAALKRQRIPPPIVLRIALDALAGLQAAHTAHDASGRPLEILHRDVTLQNVLIGRDGVARVADFGIAKSAIGHVKTDRGYVVGKLLYLPPEYLRREPFGPELDVYSLGVTMWLALSGQELFEGASEAQLLTCILDRGVPRLSTVMEVPPQLDALVARACERKASLRFPTARAMADAIEQIARDTGWLASHADVADYVEKLAGTDLARRRELIAARLATSGERAPLITRELEPPPDTHEERSWPKLAFGIGALALATAAGLFAWRAFAGAEPSAAPSTPPGASVATEPASSTSLKVEPSSAQPILVQPAPTPVTTPRSTPSKPSSRPAANPSKPAGMSTVKPPDGIATENPYNR